MQFELVCILALGDGWAPATLDTQVEHDFLNATQGVSFQSPY